MFYILDRWVEYWWALLCWRSRLQLTEDTMTFQKDKISRLKVLTSEKRFDLKRRHMLINAPELSLGSDLMRHIWYNIDSRYWLCVASYCIYVLTLKEIIKITSKFPNKTNKSYLYKTRKPTKISFEVMHGIVSFAMHMQPKEFLENILIWLNRNS